MNKTLLLLATLGSVGVLAGPAAAGDYDRSHLRAPPSFGVRIFVHPAPKVVRHHHRGAWQLRPQPVFRFGDPRPIRQFGHPSPRPLFGHLPPRPHLGHFPPRPHFGHLPPRLHFGHLPARPRFWHGAPHSSWRQPWQHLPHFAERPQHRDHDWRPPRREHSWRHGERRWDAWPRRDFADRQWQQHSADRSWRHRRGDHPRRVEWQKGPGRRHGGHGGRRH